MTPARSPRTCFRVPRANEQIGPKTRETPPDAVTELLRHKDPLKLLSSVELAFGEDACARYLYASGQPNPVAATNVLPESFATQCSRSIPLTVRRGDQLVQ